VAVSGQSGWESALILPSFRILKYEIVEETRSFVCWFIGLIIGDAKACNQLQRATTFTVTPRRLIILSSFRAIYPLY
jgi:hypothetical protein